MKEEKIEKFSIGSDEKITRKEAFKKVGITALAATSLLFLNTKSASATSYSPARPGRETS
jgi:hypothetical protein